MNKISVGGTETSMIKLIAVIVWLSFLLGVSFTLLREAIPSWAVRREGNK